MAHACPEIDGLVDTNCDRRLVILCFGDSITFGLRDNTGVPPDIGYPGRMRAILPHAEIVNLGVPGEVTYDGRRRAPGAFNARREGDYVLILEGVNDYYKSGTTPRTVRDNVIQIRNSALNIGAETMVAKLIPTLRSFQRTWVIDINRELAPYSRIDFYSLGTGILSFDQLHPDGFGYQRMAEFAVARLVQISNSIRPVDSDLDGVYDYEEARLGTNPRNIDSDGDGISDGDELYVYGSNPLSLDSDGDGISDHDEVQTGGNPASPIPGAPRFDSLDAINP